VQLKKKHRRHAANRRRCWYCGDVLTRRSVSIDHQVPLSRNGSDEKSNKVLACKSCNNKKDDRDVKTYRYFLQDKLAAGERVIFWGERN
jgi:5-methylcytosine-specific restriction endonuclease McrA